MDTIYWNGTILTMEGKNAEDEKKREPEALLVRDGKIAALGMLSDVESLCDKDVKMVDLQGKCLMPAFIDSHGHFVMNGQMALCADLSECTCFADIISTLKQYISCNNITSEQMVLGFGYDHNFLQELEHPDKRVLDKVSVKIPIIVLHVSAHLACANSVALELAGLHKDTPDPDGGKIGRLPGSMEPSGYLEETAMIPVQKLIGGFMKPDMTIAPELMQKSYLENGITTVQDGASGAQELQVLKALAKTGLLKVDVVAYPLMNPEGDSFSEDMDDYGAYQGHVKIGGYKLVLDGSPQGRSAWLSKPYVKGTEGEGYSGYPWHSDEEVCKCVKRAVQEKKQLLAHCNGDAASEQFLNAYERAVEELACKDELRPVMIHCQTVRNDQLDRMAGLQMVASVFVGHVWYWGDVHMKNLGYERGERVSPVKAALDRGVIVNFHQDTPVTKPNMLHSVWCAVNRVSRQGKVIGPEQRVTVYEALKAVTVNGAYQYFEENSKGSLAVGKRADMIILDQCPLDVDCAKIKDIKVVQTIKDGAVVMPDKV
jgi:predicted amidohydrolase YtcJ